MISLQQWGLVAAFYLGINAFIALISIWALHTNEQNGHVSPIREEGVTFAYLFAFMTLFALPMMVSSWFEEKDE